MKLVGGRPVINGATCIVYKCDGYKKKCVFFENINFLQKKLGLSDFDVSNERCACYGDENVFIKTEVHQ